MVNVSAFDRAISDSSVTMKTQPLTYASAMKLADELEAKADALIPCDENFRRHCLLMDRSQTFRRIANRIAAQYLKDKRGAK